ncbi:iron ABC transporter permease [Nocardiopsis sp. CNT-189]|uniref:FecCD family ABC transporter permease n=1 Tax=Nocardiopsis oceanisediminis TaxID=2816862 RepID=UPI003B2EC97C
MATTVRPQAAGGPARERPGRTRAVPLAAALTAALAASVLLAVSLGAATVPPGDTLRYVWAALTGGPIGADEVTPYTIIWQVRAPRVLLAAVVGAGLAATGAAVQSLVRNPLADPFILGVSSGASVGAACVVVFGLFAAFGVYALSFAAFLGALAASALVYASARGPGGTVAPLRLVLTGVAMAFGFQALMSVLVFASADGEASRTVLFWLMGSLGSATWGSLPVAAAAVLLAVVALHRSARSLDVLALGDETAASMGVDPSRMRRRLFLLTAVVTGALVAVSGAIGFVGLVMPHLVRMLVGAGHARVLLVAPPAGALLLVWVDLVARTLVAPQELPLGVITALIGVPVFVGLMRRRGHLFGGAR